jgi:N-acetylmuramic acid 6-phosphate etherase
MATFTRITEQDSKYRQLQDMSVLEVLTSINNEDQTVPHAVAAAINDIEKVVSTSIEKMLQGGRLFYI